MKIAYVTLATNKNFLIGAYNLYKTYLQVNSNIPFYCMILNEVNTAGFEDLPVIIVPNVNANKKYPEHLGWLNKINIFLLTQFDIVFWIDADSLMLNNIDDEIKIIALKLKQNNFNIIDLEGVDFKDKNKHICGGFFGICPSYDLYIKSIGLAKVAHYDEEIFTELKKQNLLYIDDKLRELFKIPFYQIFHWDNYNDKKYWNTKIGQFLFNYYIENKEKAFELIQELKNLNNEKNIKRMEKNG